MIELYVKRDGRTYQLVDLDPCSGCAFWSSAGELCPKTDTGELICGLIDKNGQHIFKEVEYDAT